MPQFDVVIVGAGPAGSAAAYRLAKAGQRVLLLDQSDFPRDKICGDCLTPRALTALKKIDLLDAVNEAGYASYTTHLRLDDQCNYAIDFASQGDDIATNKMVVLPRIQLDHLLLKHAVEKGGATFRAAKVARVGQTPSPWVELQDGERIEAAHIMLATGAVSKLLLQAGILQQKPTVVQAARCYVSALADLPRRAAFFFDGVDLPGYGWIFPIGDNSANIGCGIFTQGRSQEKCLADVLENHPLIQKHITENTRIGPLRTYPIRTDFNPKLVGVPSIWALGESLGLVNPITGEGIDYALESAELAAEALLSHSNRPDAALKDFQKRLHRRFALRFRLYHWYTAHYMSGKNLSRILRLVQKSPCLQRLSINGIFGKLRKRDLLSPKTLFMLARVVIAGR